MKRITFQLCLYGKTENEKNNYIAEISLRVRSMRAWSVKSISDVTVNQMPEKNVSH